jgi:hypothetical protein
MPTKSMPRSTYQGSRARRRFGRGRITVIDQGLAYASLRRAKIGFWIAFLLIGGYTVVGALSVTTTGAAWLIGLLTGLAAGSAVFVLAFCWPALRLTWHWAAELTAAGVLLWAYSVLTTVMTVPTALAVLALAIGGPFTSGPARRRLTALGWCVISRHRLRVCFAEFIHARHTDGRLPLILLARPTPAGERIWVWLRAGLCLDDLTDRFEEIAVATWATDAHAVKSERWAALIRVDLTRRNALAATVGSPLTDTIPTGQQRPAAAVPRPVFVSGLDLPDIPDTPTGPPPDPFRRTGTPPRPAAPRRPPATPPTAPTGSDETADWI